MKNFFDEPKPTKELLKTYGCFFMHCGIEAFGSPGEDDNHSQHGELPNADYNTAYIECGDDYMAVGGSFNYDVSYTRNYTFSPERRLYADATKLIFNIELENRRSMPMEYMYMAHINFRSVDGAELIYSGGYKSVRAYQKIEKPQTDVERKLFDYLNLIEKDPTVHHKVGGAEQYYNPEICFNVKYSGDENNRAYTLQYTEESADFVSHPVDVLPEAIRWISKTEDEDAMAMVLPATAEHLGYNYAKRNGQIKILGPKEKLCFTIEAGVLSADDACVMKERIEKINKK